MPNFDGTINFVLLKILTQERAQTVHKKTSDLQKQNMKYNTALLYKISAIIYVTFSS